MNDKIMIRGARVNNLKNIDLDLPRNKMIVMTGLSGSGKTSLAFDTIYAEGQRRYVESLSSYARQFLGGVDKPDVDMIEGLSPAIAIDQKTTSNNPRSTVATITEIYDYLRLLYARCGIAYCPNHNEPIVPMTVSGMVRTIMAYPENERLEILADVVANKKGTFKDLFDKLKKDGYIRVYVDDELYDIESVPELDKNKRHNIEVVVDRILKKPNIETRLNDSLEIALGL
ncbi:MAG: excinuclease ABC subunit UvrA, partial [Erysipelotrichaceae bacterium]|nr:excinuclease ABC subunit UvrA [Erysipelotrichaceae bacterium]